MMERYSSKKNLDVAYQGDFEDAAWTKFSDAQLPSPRFTLEDFAKNPFIPGEITSKGEYIKHVIPWFSKALIDAGYKNTEVDGLIQKSLDAIDFNRPADAFVADINRIIQNFYKGAPVKNSSAAEATPSVAAAPLETNTVEASIAPTLQNIAVSGTVQNQVETSPFAKKPEPIRSADDAVPTSVDINTKTPDANSLSSVEIKHEDENLPLATEFEERKAEYEEYGNRKIVPQFSSTETSNAAAVVQSQEKLILKDKLPETLVLTKDQILPEPLILSKDQILPDPLILSKEQMLPDMLKLTPEMQVTEANEPIVLQTTENPNELLSENIDVAALYQNKLDALNAQPFDHTAYFEYVFDLHTGLRHQYDKVINDARNNLKRFDGIYAPSTVEKQALQLLSSLQGQYAKMQNPASDYGLSRGAVSEKLSADPTETTETEIKQLTQNYLDASQNLFANISKLAELIEVAKTEEKSSVSEVYRAHFEKMQTEGNQVLQSLPKNHPLYNRLEIAVGEDLRNIIDSLDTGGDSTVRDDLPNLTARRGNIKDLIVFVKQEHDYQDYFSRARAEVEKIESEFERLPDSAASAGVKQLLAKNIVEIKQVLAKTSSTAETDGVIDTLLQQKNIVMGLLKESAVLITSLPTPETVLKEPTGASIMSPEEILAVIQKQPPYNLVDAQQRYDERNKFVPMFEYYLQLKREADRKALEPVPNWEKVKQTSAKILRSKVFQAGVVVLASIAPSKIGNQPTAGNSFPNSIMSAMNPGMPVIDYVAIDNFLRSKELPVPEVLVKTAESTPEITETKPPVVNETAPILQTPEEVVPGVILTPDTDSGPNIESDDSPLEIFSGDADTVPSDPGIILNSNTSESIKLGKHLINYGDIFWDINEGQTLAGNLPVMSQINPYFKQALIDRVRDKINSNTKERELIGGFGKDPSRPFADQLVTGEYMNLDALNKLVIDTAAGYGYLKRNL